MKVTYSFDEQDRVIMNEFNNVSIRLLQVSTARLDEEGVKRVLKEDIGEGIRYLNMLKGILEGALPGKPAGEDASR